ncbi:MAG: porphobilinogen synthase, partial [Caldilineae bacterium]
MLHQETVHVNEARLPEDALALRPRRLRMNPALRRMVRETTLSPADFIYPLFVRPGRDVRKPIGSMPGQFQLSVDQLAREAEEIASLGIPAVILFGIPEEKDWCGSDNFNPQGIVPQAIRAIKDAVPELVVVSDMCFCEYTDHGHCGVINTPGSEHYDPRLPQGYLLNDPTLELLGRASVVHAEA